MDKSLSRCLAVSLSRCLAVSLLAVLLLLGVAPFATAQSTETTPVELNDTSIRVPLGPSLRFLEDPEGRLTFDEVANAPHAWQRVDREVANFGITDSAYWMHVRIHNTAATQHRWYLEYADPMFQYLQVYVTDASGKSQVWRAGSMETAPSADLIPARTHVFPLDIAAGDAVDVLIRAKTPYSFLAPVYLWRPDIFAEAKQNESILHGVYVGIIIALALYNLSVFIYLRERVYLLYLAFMLSIAVNSLCLNGLIGQHVLAGHPTLLNAAFALSFNVYSITAAYFSGAFLGRSKSLSLLVHLVTIASILAVMLWVFGNVVAWTLVTTAVGFSGAVVFFMLGVQRWRYGNPAAGFYTIGFGSFLTGVFVFSSMVFALLPVNTLTYNAPEIGSAFEAILLSTALSRRIKQMRDQEQQSAQALAAAQGEKLAVIEQHNQTLDDQVKARTAELVATQQKLIASEKMAALGVFTAGMAHEINNPANFVSVGAQNSAAQIKEFRDFVCELLSDDPDPEITAAFDSRFAKLEKSNATIAEGVVRIEKVVKQLRSDHPEGDVGMQPADVVDSLESAWRVLSPTVRTPIVLSTQMDARPQVSCMIAEIHQVFLALLSNAAHAIEDAVAANGPDYRGQIKLASHEVEGRLVITISDNGIGIRKDMIDKVFDPFFTTKSVGRGAGLGLSMAQDVVKKHGGMLEAESVEGQGATFTLTLPPVHAVG